MRMSTFYFSFNIDLDDTAFLSILRSPIVGEEMMERKGIGLEVYGLRGRK